MAVVSQSLPAEPPLFLYPCLREYLSGLALNCLDWATSFPRRGRRLGGGTSFELISFSSLLPQKQQPRSAALKLDWVKVSSSLGLRGQTAASLQAFKQRNETARRRLQALSEQPTAVDFAHYRSVLKNQAVVDEVERRFKDFKPAAYDVQRQLKAIDAFEVEAVRNAQAAKEKVDLELKDLEATLTNIETARPFDELTVVCVLEIDIGDVVVVVVVVAGKRKRKRRTATVATICCCCVSPGICACANGPGPGPGVWMRATTSSGGGSRGGSGDHGQDKNADSELQDEVATAEPSIDEKTAKLVSKGRWSVPGYKVRYFILSSLLYVCAIPRFTDKSRHTTGKIRRPLRTIDSIALAHTVPFPLCTLAL